MKRTRVWDSARAWFPGLLLEAVGEGGIGAAAYVVVFSVVTAIVFSRRDVT